MRYERMRERERGEAGTGSFFFKKFVLTCVEARFKAPYNKCYSSKVMEYRRYKENKIGDRLNKVCLVLYPFEIHVHLSPLMEIKYEISSNVYFANTLLELS